MKEHHYILQYYIYSVAVHLYLSQRLKDYDYDTHFGGVFYLFTRGVDGVDGVDMEDKISTGIFRDRLDKKLIEDLTECLIYRPSDS